MEKRLFQLFEICVAVTLVLMFTHAVRGFGGSSCVCYYATDCEFDDDGYGYRYQQCTGSCAAYSKWVEEPRCQSPNYPSDYYPYDWKYS